MGATSSFRNTFRWRAVIVLICVNIIVRASWLMYMHPAQQSDFAWYFARAVDMAQGHGYVWNSHPTAYWPVGWPFFLSLLFRITGPHVMAGLIENVLLSTGIVCLVYLTANRIFQSNTVALCAAIGYTVLPSQIQWNAVLGSEELFTFLIMLALYLYLRTLNMGRHGWLGGVVVSGVVMGLACDVRPLPLLFPVFMLAYEWWVQRRGLKLAFARICAFGVAMLAAVAPVTLRNLAVLRHFVLVSTNGGVNLWQGTQTDSGYFWSTDPARNPLLAAHGNEIAADHIGKQYFIHHFLSNPVHALYHGLLKIYALYHQDINAVYFTFQQVADSSTVHLWYRVDTLAYWLFMLLAVVGLAAAVFRQAYDRRGLIFLLTFVLYYTLEFLAFPAWDRFRFPLMPLFALLLGAGVSFLLFRAYRKDDFGKRTQSRFT